MTGPANINPHIVEALYSEAMLLADEIRDAFDLSARISRLSKDEDLARIALSCEALRATTRIMHTIAWLLNQRAFFSGELSEFQLKRHGRLPKDKTIADSENLVLLAPVLRELIGRTQRFHARIARLDAAWRDGFSGHPGAVHRLRERLGQAVSPI